MAEPKPFPWRGLALALAGLMILCVAGGAGAFLGGVRLDRPGAFAGDRPAYGMTRALLDSPRPFAGLSAEQRRSLRERVGGAWRAAAPYREASRAARLEAMQAARNDPYDPNAMRAALARVREADAAVNAAVHDALAEAMAGLAADEREALLMAGARLRERWARRGGAPAREAPIAAEDRAPAALGPD